MKLMLFALAAMTSTSVFASQIKYTCTTLGGKKLEFQIDFSKVPKRLVFVKENNQDITSQATLDQGTKNTFAVILGGKVRIEKASAMVFQQVVAGGKPGTILCAPEIILDAPAEKVDVY
jgi:hypothetical protein